MYSIVLSINKYLIIYRVYMCEWVCVYVVCVKYFEAEHKKVSYSDLYYYHIVNIILFANNSKSSYYPISIRNLFH